MALATTVRARKADVSLCLGELLWQRPRGILARLRRTGQAVAGMEERVGDPPSILGPYNPVDIGRLFDRFRGRPGRVSSAADW